MRNGQARLDDVRWDPAQTRLFGEDEGEDESEELMTLSEATDDGRESCQECRQPIREWYDTVQEDSDDA